MPTLFSRRPPLASRWRSAPSGARFLEDMPIRELSISIEAAWSYSNRGWCTARLMHGRAAAATVPTPIRTDLMRAERCSDSSATTLGRVAGSARAVTSSGAPTRWPLRRFGRSAVMEIGAPTDDCPRDTETNIRALPFRQLPQSSGTLLVWSRQVDGQLEW